jgi:mannan endo-1,4-beta-mannosidase
MRLISFLFVLFLTDLKSQSIDKSSFVQTEKGDFILDNKPYTYIGANYWYAAFVAMDQKGKERIERELDFLKESGVVNLRLMASGEGPKTEPFRITPTLQESVGDWNEDVLVGLDFVLAEMGKRNMKGVLCLNNFFYWSGGMAQYVSWFTGEKIPYPEEHSWDAYMRFSARFYTLPKATDLYYNLIEKLVSRKNTITNEWYVNDPTIMSWQLANEPREFGHDKKYFKWVKKSSDLIRNIDENHLICIGNEGILDHLVGSTYKKTAALKNIDYLTVHLWPENWGWYAPKNPEESFEITKIKSKAYLEKNAEVSKSVLKPIVLEEFGLARDGGSYEASAEVNMRNKFYQFLYEITLGNPDSPYRGMNFWAIGGEGKPRQPETFWQAGDDYIGDPPHEKQGWYSVYFTDSSTFEWLKKVQK